MKGPGASLFEAVQSALNTDRLPFVAENLGVITPEVEALRERLRLPGMAILQFAFGNDPQAPDFKPHNYPRNLVVYTGTHDNDTTVGWWTGGSRPQHAVGRGDRETSASTPAAISASTDERCTGSSSARCWRRSRIRRSFRRRTCWAWAATRA